jgi:hypothetical protein
MSSVEDDIEQALEHIDALLDEDDVHNEWVLRKARQALVLELWQYESES